MAQASLNFDPTATAQAALPFMLDEVIDLARHDAAQLAYAIGRDHAEHGLRPPVDLLLGEPALRRGWQTARLAFSGRQRAATPQVRQWLNLRLQAWQEGRHLELHEITPHYLGQLAAAACPVTREPLCSGRGNSVGSGLGNGLDNRLANRPDSSAAQHSTDSPEDRRADASQWARIHQDAAYAGGNLACLSSTAALAMSDLRWHDAFACASACRGDAAQHAPASRQHAGLSANAWSRLAVLMSFVTALPHERAARLPLLVLPPNRLRLLNPVQGLQALVTLQLARSGWSQRLPAFEALLPGDAVRRDFKAFFMRLLTQALAAGRPDDAQAWRWALEDAWHDAQVQQLWTTFALQLGASQCERLLAAGAELGLVGQRLVVHSVEQATEGWALDTLGYASTAASLSSRAARARQVGQVDTGRATTRSRDAALPLPPPNTLPSAGGRGGNSVWQDLPLTV